ncbi:MAG: FliO/MopB family protein [Firmicutes bacterium]|nr:FliO/MopB family protein [Bacillota bacterium]
MDAEILWGLIRVLISLALIIPAVFYATRWYAKRQSLGKSVLVQEIISLGTNKALYVVEWEGVRMLLGVTGQSITVLKQQSISPETKVEEDAT